MKTDQRRASLAEHLTAHGELTWGELARTYQVSEMTIRRDVDALARDGLVRRIPGGVSANAAYEPPFASRVHTQAGQKEGIARAAVGLLERGSTVLIDSGSTAYAVAKAIKGNSLGLTVVTANVLAALELVDEPDTQVIVLGGELRPGEMSLIGLDTVQAISRYNIDTFLMGVGGIDAERGVSDYNRAEAAKKVAAIASSRRVIACVDASKLGESYLYHVAALSDLHHVVTDGASDGATLEAARAAGVHVSVVEEIRQDET